MVSKGLSNSARKPFGENAEMYLRTLFEAEMIKDNSNLPDLRIPGTDILVECKSSKKPKVDVVIDQMEYYLRGNEEFQGLCREFEPRQSTLGLFHDETEEISNSIYYSIIIRNDGLGEADILQDLSGTKLNWQGQFIIPAQLVWTLFHLDYSRKIRIPSTDEYRKTITPQQIKKERIELLRNIASTKASSHKKMYELRNELGRQSWQNVTHNTLLSLFYDTNQGARPISKWLRNRVPKYYEGFRNLKKVEVKGPDGFPIRMLVEPKDLHGFEDIQDKIKRNSPLIERIRKQRESFLETEISKIPVKLKSGRVLDFEFAKKYYHHSARPKGFTSSSELDELLQHDPEFPESRIFKAINSKTGEVGPIYRSYPRILFDSDPNGIKRKYPGLEHVFAACQWREF